MNEEEKRLEEEAAAKAKLEEEAKAKAEQEEKGDEDDDDDDFIKSLLEDEDDDDEDDDDEKKKLEEERRKNKDAEEARKRREAEAKAKAEQEKKAKEEEEAKRKAEEDKAKEEENLKSKRAADEEKLGAQLVEFKKKNPDVDLQALDKDKNFRKFIDGKLLGKKDFSELYEDYVEFKSDMSGVTKDIVQKNYQKANSSSGASKSSSTLPNDIYSEEELNKIAEKLPFMNRKEAAKVEAKLEKSIAYYEKK